jgi:pimeloyl-CoA dehydrogenase
MHFDLDSEQRQLQDSLRRLLQDKAPFARRRDVTAGDLGFDAALWESLAELGIAAIALPEAHGGLAQPPVAQLPVLQELGRSLALTPFLPSVVLAATAVARCGSPAQQEALLPGIAAGTRLLAFAHEEPAGRHAAVWVEATARRSGHEWLFDGHKHNVLYGASAECLVVSARVAGAPDDPRGLALFLVRTDQPAVRCTPLRWIDDTPVAEFDFSGAAAQPLGDPDDGQAGWRTLQAVQEAGMAAACAEALGVAERAFELTVEYVQARQQFGKPLAANQALRHRVAEMRVALDMLRSAALAGVLALEIQDAQQRARELSRAKMLMSRHGIFLAQQAIQLHGGIGMTIEYPVGHCLRRLTVLDQLFGDGAAHAARLGAALAADGPAGGIVAKDDAPPVPAS